MGFEPSEKYQTVIDKDTGAIVELRRAGSSRGVMVGSYATPAGERISFYVWYKDTAGGPNAIIDMPAIDRSLQALRHSNEENTRIVMYLITGIVAIEQEWPVMQRAWFGTNYDEYVVKGRSFVFSKPSDAELTKLSGR